MRVQTIIALVITASMVLLAQAEAARPEILYRLASDPRPGGELVVEFVLGSASGGGVEPVGDASYRAYLLRDDGWDELPVQETGMGTAMIRIPIGLESLLGGSIILRLHAYSEDLLVNETRVVEIGWGADYYALVAIASSAIPVALAVAMAVRRR